MKKTLLQILMNLNNYAVLNMLTDKHHCKIRIFAGFQKDKQGKKQDLYLEAIWDLTKKNLEDQNKETQKAIEEMMLKQ